MTNENLRMQMLSGVITEGQYKAKLQENEEKDSLNESMIGGIVGIGAINQIPSRAKTDYENAFEHYLGEMYDDIKEDRKAKEYIQSIEDEDEREEERKRMFDDPNDELVEEKDFKLSYSDDLMKIESEYLSDGDKLNDIIDTYENHIKMLRSIINKK